LTDPINDKGIPDLTAQASAIAPPQRDAVGVAFVLAAIFMFEKLSYSPA
jgi:hypothetical protein